jgi:anti-sigma factor RsiW
MTTSPSFRDIEQLSAYLDDQLPQAERTRLEIRLKSDPALTAALEDLRQTRALLRRTPRRRAPRNFTLSPRMAGIRPPVPRLVPVLSWASAVAMVLFVFTLGTSLVGQLPSQAAPMMAASSRGLGGGPAAAATMVPATLAPAAPAPVIAAPATQLPATDQTILATPSAEAFAMSVPEAASPSANGAVPSPLISKTLHRPLNPWELIWPGLAVLLGAASILVLWLNKRTFQRKNPPK